MEGGRRREEGGGGGVCPYEWESGIKGLRLINVTIGIWNCISVFLNLWAFFRAFSALIFHLNTFQWRMRRDSRLILSLWGHVFCMSFLWVKNPPFYFEPVTVLFFIFCAFSYFWPNFSSWFHLGTPLPFSNESFALYRLCSNFSFLCTLENSIKLLLLLSLCLYALKLQVFPFFLFGRSW